MSELTYRLVSSDRTVPVPVLDEHQQSVVDHPGGPLLVLAGPGTGKTTTLVEAIVDRVERRGVDPESILALTFSRKAAEQLRDRVTARLGRTTSAALCTTFHSFAYGLVREFAPPDLYAAPLRLLSAPEADVALHQLLVDAEPAVSWPTGLRVAAGTRGFTRELAALLARVRERGIDDEGLIELGRRSGLPELVSSGQLLERYLTHLDDHAATDYPDLMRRMVIEARAHQELLRERFTHVFVDEYQDTDPGQVELLQVLAGHGGNLVAVGDPHQSIYGFRGAEVRGILDFPTTFRTARGASAPVIVLQHTRRFGADLLAASQSVASRLPLFGGIPTDAQRRFRSLVADESAPGSCVEAVTFDTERAEVENIADILRRAHLEEGVPWGRMAVLVRSGAATIPALRRGLAAAGVPVGVAADETPLMREPVLMPLLTCLRLVAHLDEHDPASPHHLGASEIEDLLHSPLIGLDATAVRVLARMLRRREVAAAAAEDRTPKGSGDLVRSAVLDPSVLAGLTDHPVPVVSAFAELLQRGRELLEDGASVEQLLWHFWSASRWKERLQRALERGGAAARRAHRDLDSIVALFELAAKAEGQRGHTGPDAFVDQMLAQQIPADTLAEKGVRGECVRLLTAHRSKGLEWDLVVVAHVQQGGWPDLRRRASLLQTDRLRGERYAEIELGEPETARALLAEERRLFYVACTRARERLVVTAVRSSADDGEQPSQFLEEMGVPVRDGGPRPRRPLTLDGLVAHLRHTAADPSATEAMRRAAARRLATLADEEAGGRPLVTAASPQRWWGTHDWSRSQTPVRAADEPVRLSASTVTSVLSCPARWFLEREAGGSSPSNQAAGFGNLIHKLAEHVAGDSFADATVEDLMPLVDAVWDRIPFRTPWSAAKEREVAREVIARFLAHHHAEESRDVKKTEAKLDVLVTLPDGVEVRLHGFADRIEVDADGDVFVVDLKTGKYTPTAKEVADHPQLGIYQLAVERGAVAEHVGPGARSGGAELWHLRLGSATEPKVQRQGPQARDEEGWLVVERQLGEVAARIRAEDFPARPSKDCQFCSFRSMCPAQTTEGVLS